MALLSYNTYRVAFLPLDLTQPIETAYREQILDEKYRIWFGSAVRLLQELIGCAPLLKIPVVNGALADGVADGINEYEALFNGDSPGDLAELRTTWLLVHEGARLAVSTGVALSLAG